MSVSIQKKRREESIRWLAALVGSLGVAFPAYIVFHEFHSCGTLLLLVLVLAVGYFIGSGRDMAWVRSWGCLVATTSLCSTFFFYAAVFVNQLPTRHISEAFVLPALTAVFAMFSAVLFGACLLFLLLAVWQYKRVKRQRVKPSVIEEETK